MKDIGNVWCPWEVGHVKTRHAGSIPVSSVKVLFTLWRGNSFVECFAVKLSPLGGLWKHILVSLVRGLNPTEGIWSMWKTGFNSRYELRLVALSNYSGCDSGEQCSERGEMSNPQA